MKFTKESDFEEELIKKLYTNYGWDSHVLKYSSEQDLIDNWKNILFNNNRSIDCLGDYPLTETEMDQIINQINNLKTPYYLNGFINNGTVEITRDNEDDHNNCGKIVSLKLFNQKEIAGGNSTYQIVEQPRFTVKSDIIGQYRGDFMLLINGMPFIHVELKRSDIPVTEAVEQIKKYSRDGVYTGLFSLVQMFVAMTPEETVYFANPGTNEKIDKNCIFHWESLNNDNKIISDWNEVAEYLLSIPPAHEMIGYYTVADDNEKKLKVMRSYQIAAVKSIIKKVINAKFDIPNQKGGYIYHTTGSGKTLTSFKTAQLIATSKKADKVIFLVDRIDLVTQTIEKYKGFSNGFIEVQDTSSTAILKGKILSSSPDDRLIVSSIQKMSNIKNDGLNDDEISNMNKKSIVFIMDECHRSTNGDMLKTIKQTFPYAIFFGFTGTPIIRDMVGITDTVFGPALHKYQIDLAIRDKNVLGFDKTGVATFSYSDLRKAIALSKAKAKTEQEVMNDESKKNIYYHYMNDVPFTSYGSDSNELGIEDELPESQYNIKEHRISVIDDILNNWITLSRNGKFHALLATTSINEAIEYYRLFKEKNTDLNVTALFDPTIDNLDGQEFKEDGLVEIIEDYNIKYNEKFTIAKYGQMKKQMIHRLSHDAEFRYRNMDESNRIDILIVVDQLLTGFDSKWVNTLYLDKVLYGANLIQAFSRTNRTFEPFNEKPFGIIRFYRRIYKMYNAIDEALNTYSSGSKELVFAVDLEKHLENLNTIFNDIKNNIFGIEHITDFSKLPENKELRKQFNIKFKEFNNNLSQAELQSFNFTKKTYYINENKTIEIVFDEIEVKALYERYKDLGKRSYTESSISEVPYDLDYSILEQSSEKIDFNYINSKYNLLVKNVTENNKTIVEQIKSELHTLFSQLSEEEQECANLILTDLEAGFLSVDGTKSFLDYLHIYIDNRKNDRIKKMANLFGCNEEKLRDIINSHPTETNIREFGKFDALTETISIDKCRQLMQRLNPAISSSDGMVRIKSEQLLKEMILNIDVDLEQILYSKKNNN